MTLCFTSANGPNLRLCTMIFLTLSTFLLGSLATPLHSNDDSITLVTCIPADFKSVLIFFFANYVVHALTIPSVPGRFAISVIWMIGSLLYPFFGLIRSIILLSHYISAKDEIGKAISQGAVMVAARSKDWVPRFTRNELIYVGLLREFPENTDGTELPKARFHTIPDIYVSLNGSLYEKKSKALNIPASLNGEASLPNGYFWSKPGIAQLDALASLTLKREGIQVKQSKNIVKGIASVAQLIFSSITLYRARGSQLQRYGFAAFGLSVFPYALMSFINLIVITVVGEYLTPYVLRTTISDEAKRCGGTISGEVGTLPEESPAEEGRSMKTGSDSEDRHVTTPLPKVDDSNDGAAELLGKCDGDLLGEANKTTTSSTTGIPPEAKVIGSVGTDGEGKDEGASMSKDPSVFLSGEPLVAANLRVDNDGILVITMKDTGRTGRFKLIENDTAIDDDPLTFHFYVSALTNQAKIMKREEPYRKLFGWTVLPKMFKFDTRSILIYGLFYSTLGILPHVFIFLLTGFGNGDSTSAQRSWMITWLLFNQLSSGYGFLFSITSTDEHNTFLIVGSILLLSTPAIGEFVMVGKMLLEFGTCSLSK